MKEIKLLLLCLLPLGAKAQYPVDYFRNPLDLPLLLAGNFGECRPGHFHSGIDIKTEGKENQAVYAAAGGYISRVKMEPGGFGHAIYITHPNGYTTLYAHLNDFFAPLQELVHRKQYENRNWELDLVLAPEQFPVEKGMLIARSGNTGGSTAPHLHFEIRDTKTEHPLNPLLFGLRIADNIAPVAYKLALYDRSRSVYEQDPQLVTLLKKGDNYGPAKDTLTVKSTQTGIGLFVHDFMNGSENTLAVYQVSWYLDDVLQGKLVLDNIGYEETRYLNACADYKLKQQSGDWYNSLFLLKGNRLDHVYHELNNDRGNLVLPDLAPHRLKVLLEDAAGNSSTVSAVLLRKDTAVAVVPCENPFTATATAAFIHPNVCFRPGPAALYDDICFRFRKTPDSESFVGRLQLHDARVPLHEYTELELKPDKPVPFAWTGKMVMAVQDGKTISGKAAVLQDGWYRASVRSLGTYLLLADTTAPRILALQKKGASAKGRKELRFRVTDNLTRVKKLEGTLDGRWICMEQHGSDWFYRFDEYCPAGKHNLVLTATDENGNESRLVFPFVR